MSKLKDYPIADIYPYGNGIKKHVLNNLGNVRVNSINNNPSEDDIDYDDLKWTRKTTYKLRDRDVFIKVYKDALQMILKLSSTSQKVLWYVMSQMNKKQKIVQIITNLCMNECGFKTRKSVTDGICELLDKDVLFRTSEPMSYWVNPMIVFNGNRLQFIREYILEEEI